MYPLLMTECTHTGARGGVGRRREAVSVNGRRRELAGQPGRDHLPHAAAGHRLLPRRPAPRQHAALAGRQARHPRLRTHDHEYVHDSLFDSYA